MKRLMILALPLVLMACNRSDDQKTNAAVEAGVERSVADVQAATAAANAPEPAPAADRRK